MNKCVVCGKDSGKGKTCSPKCKQAAYRNRNKTQPPTVTDATVTPTVTKQGHVTTQQFNKAVAIVDQQAKQPLIENYGQPDCQCQMCKARRINGRDYIINHGAWKPSHLLGSNELNRASLPGDPDYSTDQLRSAYTNHGKATTTNLGSAGAQPVAAIAVGG